MIATQKQLKAAVRSLRDATIRVINKESATSRRWVNVAIAKSDPYQRLTELTYNEYAARKDRKAWKL